MVRFQQGMVCDSTVDNLHIYDNVYFRFVTQYSDNS